MKKLILFLAVCFGFFVCQDVAAQNATKVNGTPQNVSAVGNSNTTNNLAVSPNSGTSVTKQAQQVQLQSNGGSGSNTSNNLVVSPNSGGAVVTKDAQQVQLQAAQQSGTNNNNSISLPINQQPLKDGQPVQIVSKTYQIAPISLGRAVIEQ